MASCYYAWQDSGTLPYGAPVTRATPSLEPALYTDPARGLQLHTPHSPLGAPTANSQEPGDNSHRRWWCCWL
ncbi:unnamed protein product [Lota lota]